MMSLQNSTNFNQAYQQTQLEHADVIIGNKIYSWPSALIENEDIFLSIFTRDAYEQLSTERKDHLKKFLPSTEGNDTTVAQDNILDKLFNPDAVFFFGHPLRTFHRQAVNGSFNFISPSDGVRLRDNARVLYDHQIRRYYLKLLRTLIANRRSLLEHVTTQLDPLLPLITTASASAASNEDDQSTSNGIHVSHALPQITGNYQPFDGYRQMQRRVRQHKIAGRTAKRLRIMLGEVKSAVGETDALSSDDEDLDGDSKLTTISEYSVTTLTDDHWKDVQLYQPIAYADIHDMLLEYQALKNTDPEHPSLHTGNISLAEVIERCGMTQTAVRVGLIKSTTEHETHS